MTGLLVGMVSGYIAFLTGTIVDCRANKEWACKLAMTGLITATGCAMAFLMSMAISLLFKG